MIDWAYFKNQLLINHSLILISTVISSRFCLYRGLVYSSAVRRAPGMVWKALEGVFELSHAERVAEKGVSASHHHPELWSRKGLNIPCIFSFVFLHAAPLRSLSNYQWVICIWSGYPSILNAIYIISDSITSSLDESKKSVHLLSAVPVAEVGMLDFENNITETFLLDEWYAS